MPSPDTKVDAAEKIPPEKPSKLEIPGVNIKNDSSFTPSPGTSTQKSPEFIDADAITPLTPNFIKNGKDQPDGDSISCDTPTRKEAKRKGSFRESSDKVSRSSSAHKQSKRGSVSAENSPCVRRKCSKCAESTDTKKNKGLKFPSRLGKKDQSCKCSHSHRRKKSEDADVACGKSPICPEVNDLTEKLQDVPGSPARMNRSRNKSKQEQLHNRHLEKRAQQDSDQKKLHKYEQDLKVRKEGEISDEENSGSHEHSHHHHHHHHHHQRSSKRRSSERRTSHRPRSSSVNSRASSRRGSEIMEDGIDDDPTSFTVPNRWLSYDMLSQSSDCEPNKRNGSTSMIHLEYPYKPSNNSGIYISPYFSNAYRAPGAEILVASLIMLFGVAALITSYATGIHVWLIVGGVCISLGACFMLMGLCWYCRHSAENRENEQVKAKVQKLRAKLKLERSPSTLSDSREELDVVNPAEVV